MKILFVHGALVRDGAWWWSCMMESLKRHGLETRAVELPSCDGKLTDDLYADADAVRAAIRASRRCGDPAGPFVRGDGHHGCRCR